LRPSTPVPAIVALLFVNGLSRSMQFTALSTLAFAEVPKPLVAPANTLFNMAHQMSMGIGVGLAALILRVIERYITGPNILVAFKITFIFFGLLSLIAVIDVLGLPRNAGASINVRSSA
jgi:hypothetical protein